MMPRSAAPTFAFPHRFRDKAAKPIVAQHGARHRAKLRHGQTRHDVVRPASLRQTVLREGVQRGGGHPTTIIIIGPWLLRPLLLVELLAWLRSRKQQRRR